MDGIKDKLFEIQDIIKIAYITGVMIMMTYGVWKKKWIWLGLTLLFVAVTAQFVFNAQTAIESTKSILE